MLVTKGASLRGLKNYVYPSIWKQIIKPSRLVRRQRKANEGKARLVFHNRTSSPLGLVYVKVRSTTYAYTTV